MIQKKLMFNFFVNRNWSKLTDTRKRAKMLADNRKSHHPIETLTQVCLFFDEKGSLKFSDSNMGWGEESEKFSFS